MAAGEKPSVYVPLDLGTASVARMYNFYLGGDDHFPIDEALAAQVAREFPEVIPALRANRTCLGRMVRYLVDAGIRQFIDIGSGLPSQGNVHEVAQQAAPDARIAYVDNDLTVLAHARAILAREKPRNVIVVKGDARAPQRILNNDKIKKLIDFTQPVAFLLVAILHFVTEEENADRIIAALRDASVPGSYLAITAATTDGTAPEERATIQKHYRQATAPAVFRTRQQIMNLFDGYRLVDPGIVRIPAWHPVDEATCASESIGANWFFSGLGQIE